MVLQRAPIGQIYDLLLPSSHLRRLKWRTKLQPDALVWLLHFTHTTMLLLIRMVQVRKELLVVSNKLPYEIHYQSRNVHLTLQKLIPKTCTKSSRSLAVDAMEAEFTESPLTSGNVGAMEAEFTESPLMSGNCAHKQGHLLKSNKTSAWATPERCPVRQLVPENRTPVIHPLSIKIFAEQCFLMFNLSSMNNLSTSQTFYTTIGSNAC